MSSPKNKNQLINYVTGNMAKRKNGTGIILKYKQYFIVRLYAFIFFLLVLVSLGFILLSGNVCG